MSQSLREWHLAICVLTSPWMVLIYVHNVKLLLWPYVYLAVCKAHTRVYVLSLYVSAVLLKPSMRPHGRSEAVTVEDNQYGIG